MLADTPEDFAARRRWHDAGCPFGRYDYTRPITANDGRPSYVDIYRTEGGSHVTEHYRSGLLVAVTRKPIQEPSKPEPQPAQPAA